MKRKVVKATTLRKLFDYDLTTGIFYSVKNGSVLGALHEDGYLYLSIDTRTYRTDKLAWLYVCGWWPKYGVTHIDGVKLNCWISNLKANTKPRKNGSGVTGVHLDKYSNTWEAAIGINGEAIRLGNFHNFDRAVIARYRAEESVNRHIGSSAYQYFHKHNLGALESTPIKEDIIDKPVIDNNEHSHIKILGVSKQSDGKWRVKIPVMGKPKVIGIYENFDMAVVARWQAEQREDMGDDTPAAIHVRTYALEKVKLSSKSKRNKTGVTGVHFDNRSKKYKACICVNRKQRSLGLFETMDNAVLARYNAEQDEGITKCTPAQLYVQNMFL